MKAHYYLSKYRQDRNEGKCWTVILVDGQWITHKHFAEQKDAQRCVREAKARG